ncbi:MAG: hypothetical protein LIP06_05685 [Tannerellaceae bacterium]|nr:hypothetical protein [Tannerellaceae bacterium]
MAKTDNIFVSFLKALGVKYTSSYANCFFNEHPYKYTLFGISRMLDAYQIESVTIQIEEEKDIRVLEAPLLVPLNSHFALVEEITANHVAYQWLETVEIQPVEEFNKQWSGIALLAETSEKSIEPDYKKHQLYAFYNKSLKYLLWLFLLVGIGMLFSANQIYANLYILLLFLTNLAGVCISYLLLLKQYKIETKYGDKICSLLKEKDCNDVLESSAAKLWGIISWSEIGLAYFSGNIWLILINPQLVPVLALLNLFTLPYTLWSIWYQKTVVRNWCMLCVLIQAILWIIFLINLTIGSFHLFFLDLHDTLIVMYSYSVPALLLLFFVPKLIKNSIMEEITYEINSLKTNDDVILTLLK